MPQLNLNQFIAALNQRVDPSKVDLTKSEYYLLSNARVRRGVIRPIRKPRDIFAGIPALGKVQGLYAINSLQVVFVAGKAYWRNFDPESNTWTQVGGFQMSATADRIWLELVPASFINRARKITSASDSKSDLQLGITVAGTPQCAVVMDGESDAWVIFPDATARVTRRYVDWTIDNPEYVPSGCRLPQYINGVLYCVGKDSKGIYNQLYRSATGQPLNFMVAVTETGGKTSASEAEGGAPAVAYQPTFGEITAVRTAMSVDGGFVVTTIDSANLITPRTGPGELIFGEPTFNRISLFNVGALNQECIIDMLGNTALIHFAGIRDFNAILTLRNEGRNSPLSQQINDLLADVTQTYGAAISYNNYSVFAMLTRYGPAIIWYDEMQGAFVSVDVFPEIQAEIKQFASVLTRSVRRLFFITSDNHIYEYDPADGETATVRFHLKDLLPSSDNGTHRIKSARFVFGEARTAGVIQASLYADKRLVGTRAMSLAATQIGDSVYDSIPYTPNTEKSVVPVNFDFSNLPGDAWQTGLTLEWNADADLLALSIETEEATARVAESTKTARGTNSLPIQKLIFVGNDGVTNASRLALAEQIKMEESDAVFGLGNQVYNSASLNEFRQHWQPVWGQLRSVDKYYAVAGPYDMQTGNGEEFRQILRQSPTRYFTVEFANVRVILFNAGYNINNEQKDPDNQDEATFAESKQARWLTEQLSDSSKHNIVVWSNPAFCSRAEKEVAALKALMLTGAGAIINGHAGFYERLQVAGRPHFVCGTGCDAKLEATDETLSPYSYRLITGVVGYIRAWVSPLSITFEFVNANKQVLDVYVISR